MLERSDYEIANPDASVDISGNIIPKADIDGKTPVLRAEDAYYILEWMWRVGVYLNISWTDFSSKPTQVKSRASAVIRKIVDIDANITAGVKFNTYSGLMCFLTGSLSNYTFTGSDFVADLCANHKDTLVSGLTSTYLTRERFDADVLRRVYYWLNRKSKCWILLEYDSYQAAKYGKMFISYSSGLNNLSWVRWKSSSNVNPTPVSETITSDAFIYTGEWTMRSDYNHGTFSGLHLFKVTNYAESGYPQYIKGGGVMDDVYITVSMQRTDVTEMVGFVKYTTTTLNSQGYDVYHYKTVAVPFEKIGDTTWKMKIWDRSLALAFLASTGYDTSVIDSSSPVSSDTRAQNVSSSFAVYAYKVNDKAGLPSEWNWSPS